MNDSRSRAANILIFLFLFFAAFLTYRYAGLDLVRADHLHFMVERDAGGSDWGYFLRTLSFSLHSDHILFKPVFHAFLSIKDILFRQNLYAMGFIAIFLHALTCFTFYVFASKLTGRPLGFFLTLLLLIQYAGVEMINWSHMNPYMIGLNLLMVSHILILSGEHSSNPKKIFGWLFMVLTVLVFCHEFFMLTVFGTGSLAFLFCLLNKNKDASQFLTGKNMFFLFLVPIFIYAFFDFIDFNFFNPPAYLHESHGLATITTSELLRNMFRLVGIFPLAFLFPQFVQLSRPVLESHTIWDMTNIPDALAIASSIGCILFLIFCFYKFASYFQDPKKRAYAIAGLSLIIFYSCIILMLSTATATLHLKNYLTTATYYYYVTKYIFLSLIALLIHFFFMDERRKKFFKPFAIIFTCLFVWQVPYNFVRLQEFLKPIFFYPSQVAKATLGIHRALESDPEHCYGGSLDPTLRKFVPDIFLYDQHCIHSDKKPVYAIRSYDQDIWLFGLSQDLANFPSVSLPVSSFSKAQMQIDQKELGAWFSKQSFDSFSYLKVRFNNAQQAGLILHQNSEEFLFLVLYDSRLDKIKVKNGVTEEGAAFSAFIPKEDFYLLVAKIGDVYYLFHNHHVITALDNISQLGGQIGIYCQPSGPNPGDSCFSEVSIAEGNAATKDLLLKPVHKLKLSLSDHHSL